jgi:hypothetical protein
MTFPYRWTLVFFFHSLLSGSDDDDEAASEPDGPTGQKAQDWLGLSEDDSDNDADRFQVKEV